MKICRISLKNMIIKLLQRIHLPRLELSFPFLNPSKRSPQLLPWQTSPAIMLWNLLPNRIFDPNLLFQIGTHSMLIMALETPGVYTWFIMEIIGNDKARDVQRQPKHIDKIYILENMHIHRAMFVYNRGKQYYLEKKRKWIWLCVLFDVTQGDGLVYLLILNLMKIYGKFPITCWDSFEYWHGLFLSMNYQERFNIDFWRRRTEVFRFFRWWLWSRYIFIFTPRLYSCVRYSWWINRFEHVYCCVRPPYLALRQ